MSDAAAELIFQQAVDLIEPLTRFDRESLEVAGHDARMVTGGAQLSARVSFNISTESRTGQLPSGIRTASGSGELNSLASAARSSAESDLGRRLEAWAGRHPQGYELPTSSDCFDGPITFGAQSRCRTCGGSGSTTCSGCSGQGKTQCYSCFGQGARTCTACGGSRQKTCSSCGGRGTWTEQKQRSVWDGMANRYFTQNYTEQMYCGACGSSGRVNCGGCGGQGVMHCSACGDSGKITCQGCGGSGRARCSGCDGTGWLHDLRTVSCSVERSFGIEFQDANEEVAQRYRSCDLATLRNLADVRQTQVRINGPSLNRRYQWQAQISRLRIDALGEMVTLTGFGPDAQVFNFQNLVEILLRADLRLLQDAVKETPRWSLKVPDKLVAAVKHCLLSEANAVIGEARKKGPNLAAGGGISEEFSRSTAKALRSALRRIYFGKAIMTVPIVMGLPVVYSLVAIEMDWNNQYTGQMLLGLAGVLVVALVGSEWMARSQTKSLFGKELGARVNRMLAGQKVLRLWRIVLPLAGFLAIYVTFAIYKSIVAAQ